MDYTGLSFQVTFTAGSTRMCVDIEIPDDRIPEEDETFTVTIMPDPRVNPGPDGDTTVTILDNGNGLIRVPILQIDSHSIDWAAFWE